MPFSKDKLKTFKNILEEKLAKANDEVATLKRILKEQKQRNAQATNTDFNGNSKHFQQQAVNKRLLRRQQRKTRDIKAALARIEDGTYGVCERTGEMISEDRLLALPTARFSIQAKDKTVSN